MAARYKSYQPRPCVVCGQEAAFAVNVMSRTVGVGQTRKKRKLKLGKTQLFCGECATDDVKLSNPITRAAIYSLVAVA